MLVAEALGYALLAALNPPALLIGTVYLGSANPKKMVLFYLVGAIIMTAALAAALFFIVRAGGLSQVSNRSPRYGLRLGLGVVALVAGAIIARRKPKAGPVPPDGARRKQGRIARMTSRPSPLTAAIVGVLIFYPSVNFIAAVQVVATARPALTVEVLTLVLVVLVDVLAVWLPLVLYLIAPDATTRTLSAFDGWLRAHQRILVIVGLLAGGVILIVNGSLGLAGTS